VLVRRAIEPGYGKWVFPGGYVDRGEALDAAALREAREESGLEVELIGERPPTTGSGTRALIAPRFLDIHKITDTHEHIGMIYWARPKNGSLTLSPTEHHDIRWCSVADLEKLQPLLSTAVKWYCRKALEEVSSLRF
jgi:8-oxo-dGTP pyrophosphatase MutT (NUDIX family)